MARLCRRAACVSDNLLNVFNFALLIGLAFLTGLYFARYRKLAAEEFSPAAAWIRAGIFFCTCFILSWLTGTQEMILAAPLATQAQLQNPRWVTWTAGLTLLIAVGYWWVWARYTLRFDRQRHLLAQVPFGLVWGLSMGQLFLVVWHWAVTAAALLPQWGIILVAWLATGTVVALWMLFYWDLYIAPEHDTPFSITLKTIVVHVPQTFLCTIYLTLYNNYAILIGLQTLALVGAAVQMRMPPFWSRETTPAARKYPFFAGIYYAGGYVSPDPRNDRYLKAAHLPF
jgi:hypothetical protein